MKEYKIYRILLGDDPSHVSDEKICDFCSAKDLLMLSPDPGIVIFDGLKGKKTSDKLKVFWELVELRESAEFCYAPIYLSQAMQQLDSLVDGVTGNIEERLREACPILERGERVSREKLAESHDLRLLTYMYVRGDEYALNPICAPFSQWVYSYPVAALLLDSSSKASKILRPEDLTGLERLRSFRFDTEMIMALKVVAFLEENGFIAKYTLADRIRKCPKCNTGHLNYVDLCPSCGSIDFQKKNMMHCFVCGHVAEENDFKKGMSFVCPRCGSALRHLGSDYDHPLESNECNNCGSRFVEPDVKADCLFCRARTDPSNLKVVNVYSYKLTEKGSAAVGTGNMQMEIQLFDGYNNYIFNYFCRMVEWMREYRRRYPEEVFSLLGIRFFNLYEVEHALGTDVYEKLLDELVSRIRSMVRSTDMTTSSAPETFWIALPRTPLEKSGIIAQRVEELNNLIDLKTEKKIQVVSKCFEIPEDGNDATVEKYIESFSEELSL